MNDEKITSNGNVVSEAVSSARKAACLVQCERRSKYQWTGTE